MKIVLLPFGSSGDVHPLLWLGKLMRERGHDVVAVVHAQFRETAAKAGLDVVSIGTVAEFNSITESPDLWHPRKGSQLVFSFIPLAIRQSLPLLLKEIEPGRTLIVAGGLAFAGQIAAELTRTPLVSVQLQPSVFMSAEGPSMPMAGLEWFLRMPVLLRRVLLGVMDRSIDRALAAPINAIRAEYGLVVPARGIMSRYLFAHGTVLALFPDWFAARQRDWPANSVTSRFPLYDEGDHHEPSPELEAWLDAGTPPVLLTPGSANSQAGPFFAAGLEAARVLGLRALCVTPYAEQLPAALPAHARHFTYIPFSQVFPRCAAVVHHGGIGTLAQVLAAGVPQLVMPMGHDQPDNGARVRRMGVGDYLYPRQFTARKVAACLTRLVHSSAIRARCQHYKGLVAEQWEPGRVASFLETSAEAASR